jgi:AcrR family transcriptional regulator
MGHKEELLAAARRCLVSRGYARTTARDLVAESGTNLGSIGYHFGSKDALLAQALDDVFLEYTEKVLAVAREVGSVGDDPRQAVDRAWAAMTELSLELRPLLVAFMEALAQAERSDPLRTRLAEGYAAMRSRIVEGILAIVPDAPEDTARAVASFFMAVADGYTVQWLLDPDATPGGADLLAAARLALSI